MPCSLLELDLGKEPTGTGTYVTLGTIPGARATLAARPECLELYVRGKERVVMLTLGLTDGSALVSTWPGARLRAERATTQFGTVPLLGVKVNGELSEPLVLGQSFGAMLTLGP